MLKRGYETPILLKPPKRAKIATSKDPKSQRNTTTKHHNPPAANNQQSIINNQ
jgi:hypothetical protein